MKGKIMDSLMRSGEFASLCRTTKETLRHYDRIGLLRPAARGANGYRLYSLPQLVDFSLIAALQSAGLPLAEVRDYLSDPGSPRLRAVLEERIAAIEESRRELERRRQALEQALEQAVELQSWGFALREDSGDDGGDPADGAVRQSEGGYLWRIRECPQRFFVETPIPYDEAREDAFLEAAREHLSYCERHGWGSTFQETYRVDAARAAAGEYGAGLCAEMRVPAPVDSPRLRVKPAGTYLQWLNRIDLSGYLGEADPANRKGEGESVPDQAPNPLFDAYDAMHSFAEDRGWRLTGDLWDTVLSLYAGDHADELVTEVSMLIDLPKRC